jgi:hypothetical protein
MSFKAGKSYPVWFEEGLALIAERSIRDDWDYSLGLFHLQDSPWVTLENPLFKKLNTKTEYTRRLYSFYGHVQLFMSYIWQKSGPKQFYNILSQQSQDPEVLIPQFRLLFRDFQIAKYLNRIDPVEEDTLKATRFFIFDPLEYTEKFRMNHSPISQVGMGAGAYIPERLLPSHFTANQEVVLVQQSRIGQVNVRKLSAVVPYQFKYAASEKSFPLVIKHK